jgi:phosphopantothenoylcysteine synthetase/decarboxylase
MPDNASAGQARVTPALGAHRLLLVTTGTASTAFLPFWLNWLRDSYPGLEVRAALTASAQRFVTAQTLSLLLGIDVIVDAWPDTPRPAALHVELAEWAEATAVFPASAHFITRLALGICDTPVMLALQCTSKAVGLAPSVPPGLEANPVYQAHLRALRRRPNVVIARTVVGRGASTGRYEQGVAAPMWELIQLIEKRRVALAGAGNELADPPSAAAS